MKTRINLGDLSLSNFDQVMQIDEVKGGKRYTSSIPSFTTVSIPTFTFSVTTRKRRRR